MRGVYLSSVDFTISVSVDEHGIVTEAPPIARKFIGKPLTKLIVWMGKKHQLRAVSYF